MMRAFAIALLLVGVSIAAFAVDPGRSEGSLTTDKTTTTLSYAYAVRKVHNESSGKNDAVKVVLTDKALPAGTKVRDLDYNFPEGILGVVVCLDRQMQPVHVVVQHPAGVYDGGWLDLERDVIAKVKESNGAVEGRLRSVKAEKASVTFLFDVSFSAVEE